MSTNYYFVNKKSVLFVDKQNDTVKRLFSELIEGLGILNLEIDKSFLLLNARDHHLVEYEKIHIGKRSMGWKPLFQAYRPYESLDGFDSIKSMISWYDKHKNDWLIENEYGERLSFDRLEEELINWKGKKSHLTRSAYYTDHYLDKESYEWSNNEFS